jgi:hypothetical protein
MVSEVIQANTISLSVENCQLACKPGSVLPVCTRSDDHSSGTPVTKCFAQPTRAAGPEKPDIPRNIAPPLFGLAPGGVYLATPVTEGAVRSYRTFSPLPKNFGGSFSVALSLGSPPPDVIRHRFSVEPGLSSTAPFRVSRQRSPSQLAEAGDRHLLAARQLNLEFS